MKIAVAAVAVVTSGLAFAAGTAIGSRLPDDLVLARNSSETESFTPVSAPGSVAPTPDPNSAGGSETGGIPSNALTEVVQRYCASCHNETQLRGNMSLASYDVATAPENTHISEKIIRKLRADMMPPPGARRPGGDTLRVLAETLERMIDRAAGINPGHRPFQRLNRPEYEATVRDLLGVHVIAGDFLPLDTKSANFDNVAAVQALSPTLLDSYLNAAATVARIALGDRNAPSTSTTYETSLFAAQHPWDYVEGAPYGTRGGVVAIHNFPADGMYTFRVSVGRATGVRKEDIDVSVNGERVFLLRYEPGVALVTEPIFVKAGQHKVSAAFVRKLEGPYEDLIKPHEWSNASGAGGAGVTTPPHVQSFTVAGPQNVTGLSETVSRKIIFSCYPKSAAEERPCAEQIVDRLGLRAYRRPLTDRDRESLLTLYDRGTAAGGFEEGIRMSLQGMLANPYFVFRLESTPPNVRPGEDFQISDYELASRLSFFLWGSIPDDELLTLAQQRRLSDRRTLERQVRRMLADPKSEALAHRFAGQWLRLQDLDKVHPDPFWYPDYDSGIADAMRRETEMLFMDIVRRDRPIFDLLTANYTFVNEKLARHYGFPNVAGTQFRRVEYPDDTRRGLLGHGSVLVQTSFANRTSPVLRGKWVMEVLMGMEPPPPPPDVPDLEQTAEGKEGRPLSTRERMEIHSRNPTCNACHQYMDPIGLALDNFDVTGKWRYRESGADLDTRGQMYDGLPVSSPSDLAEALLVRPIPLVRAFAENLMTYGLGRRIEDYDQPAIRQLVKEAERDRYRFSSFVLGVVNSSAFRSKRAEGVAEQTEVR